MALTQISDQPAKGVRINKETGELSASGELSVSVESKSEKVEELFEDTLPQVLLKQLYKLGIHSYCDQTTEHASVPYEEALAKVLPLYVQICEDGGTVEVVNLKGLAILTADTIIHNIHSRLAEKPADEARNEVVVFFQRSDISANFENSGCPGWLLLKSLVLLTADSLDVLSYLNLELPAALVKCLYLLVCLPPCHENKAIEQTLQEPLTQVILHLCRLPGNVECLVETQELQCLIIGLTSLWDQTSALWRHQASRVLKAVSANATKNIIPSLQGKHCIRICIQNLLHLRTDVSGPLLAEVAVAVFSFIKDTYALSPTLFEVFDTNNGYKALENILTCCEQGVPDDCFPPVEELIALVAQFTLFGKTELKVAVCISNPQPTGFKFDLPQTTGSVVKNLPAFRLLLGSLLRSQDSRFCCQILQTLEMIWGKDNANFFLLEWSTQIMTQLASCLLSKPTAVHKQFFSLLELIIFKLNYIPHETLRAVLTVLKQTWTGATTQPTTGLEFGVAALRCFHRITVHSGLLTEVLSDWGLMKLLLGELRRRAKILIKAVAVSSDASQLSHIDNNERLLTNFMLHVLSTFTLRSIKNTVSVRELGMVPYIKIFLNEDQYRDPTLCILEQLAEINPDEFMSIAIGALCTSTQQEMKLKKDLLQSVLKVLENPNSWNAFRKAGGFAGLLSLVTDMEGAFANPPIRETFRSMEHEPVLEILLLTLHTLALAVHLHKINAHYFEMEGYYEKLTEALFHLGCFHHLTFEENDKDMNRMKDCCPPEDNQPPTITFKHFVESAESTSLVMPSSLPKSEQQIVLPVTLKTCIRLMSYLSQFAVGTFSFPELTFGIPCDDDSCKPNILGEHHGVEDSQGHSRKTAPSISIVSSESHYRFSCDDLILYPGSVRIIMTLLSSVFSPEDPQLSMDVQYSLVHHVQALIKSERNRQIMCEGGLIATLLAHCGKMLIDPKHLLHLPVTRILEKLSSQAVTLKDFRKFLCLGNPLMCLADKMAEFDLSEKKRTSDSNEIDKSSESSLKTTKRTFSLLNSKCSVGSGIPAHQIISLVSMTSPRTYRPYKVSTTPAFVEFDMSESGYGCLFLPSLATVKGVTADSIPIGGTGGDCRGFPPTAGLTFSCWFQINRFSSACESHPIRFLSVVRHMSRTEQQFICLSISLSACDGCLVISTEEEALTYLEMMEPELSSPTSLATSLRFRCANVVIPGQWHHLAVVLTKDIKKSCLVSAYLNGKPVGTGKMRYIQPFPGAYASMESTAVTDVYALIGTPALWKAYAALVWKVGPSYLFEEPLTSETVSVLYLQGTAYLGNFLSVCKSGVECMRLVPEERISFGINPAISTVTTVAQIREHYNEVDCRLIAKEVGITSRDNSTPVFLAHNISQHLSGTARTIGAALVGHFGVRAFTPRRAATGFLCAGGPTVILSLVAMAPDDSSLYAAVKVLLSVLQTDQTMQQEMARIDGYKLLAFILKSKSNIVSNRTLQLVLSLSDATEASSESIYQHTVPAFKALISDLEVWQSTSENLDLTVLNHFINSFSDDNRDAKIMHNICILPKMLFVLPNPSMTHQKVEFISTVITLLLTEFFNPLDINRLGLFLVSTIPPQSNTNESLGLSESHHNTSDKNSGPVSQIYVRNKILCVLSKILHSDKMQEKERQVIFETLGSGWFLLFLQSHLHPSTIKLGLSLLSHLLFSPSLLTIFREKVSPWSFMEEPASALDNLQAHSSSFECPTTTCTGFDVLKVLLVRHCSLYEVYETMVALLLGKKLNNPKENLLLDNILQSYIDDEKNNQTEQLCVEAAIILLELIKAFLNPISHTSTSDPGLVSSVMQFFCLLHNLRPRDPLWTLPDFLHTLASAVHYAQNMGDEDVTVLQRAPARKPVCDFICILLMDSLLNYSDKNSHPLVILMEFPGASQEQSLSFQTELVEFVIDIIYVLSGEEENGTHLSSEDSNNQVSEGHLLTMMENVVLFTKIVVQKLYSGMIMGDCRSLLHFLADQIVMVLENGQTQKDKILSELYSSINRVMLFFLSQPQHIQNKEVMIKTLETVLDRWDVVMATYNANVNFITCFLFCLLMARSGRYPECFAFTSGKVHNRNASSQIFPAKIRHYDNKTSSNSSISDDQKLESLVEACWSKLMKERQYMLEESFKTEISACDTGKTQLVQMSEISPLWEEIVHKGWQLYTDSLKKTLFSSSQKTFDRISNAVSSVLSRFSKESSTVEEFIFSMDLIQQNGQKMFESMRMNHIQLKTSEWERLSCEWLDVEAELLRERAIFGPGPGVFLSRGWVQDAAEGPNRTKPHIRRRTHRRSNKVMEPECLGSESAEAESEAKILCEVGAEVKENVVDEEQECVQLTFFPVLTETPASTEAPSDLRPRTPCPSSADCSYIRIILKELPDGDEVKAKMCIVTVSGLRVTEGVLLFGKDSVYLCEGFTLSSTGDVCCRNHHPTNVRNSYIASMLSKDLPVSSCRRWLYEDIKDARFMRYLLEDHALEIFMKNGHSAFLVFLNKDHVNAYKKLCLSVPSLKGRGVAEVIANARKSPVLEKTSLLRWQRGEISNFEYLMHLNTLAGRTYSDLMQYPVFPWILADYESKTLDLNSPASFRDLSKPMGAQTEKRKQMFIQRYKEVGGNEGEGELSAQCHYCTHYSSAIIVSSFLVRMEPFSHTYHTLQGGFDIPERMFYSLRKEWDSASRDNMGDVRELIPEFFYLPDFLVNSNHINLGCMEDGTPLGDVELPPWAKGDPKEFIRVHREALESDYVSSHLHLWIDLIFGYKQQGPAAVESVNLFHPYFYAQRGRTDSKDPLIKSLKLGYVSNFGQVPKQLFTRPHAPRFGSKKEAAVLSTPLPFFFRLDKLKTLAQPFRELSGGPVGQILCVDKDVLILERNRLFLSPALNCYFSWGFPDNSCAFGNYTTGKTFAVNEELCVWGETLCAVCPNPTTVVTSGTSTVVCVWDVAVTKDKLSHMKLKQPLYGHIDAVTCLAVSEEHSILVSGSRDFTCILWDLEELSYVTQLAGHTGSVSAVAINDLTGDIASCAGSQLYLWTMRGQLLARTNTSCGPQADILCVRFSQRHEWDARNVIVTGNAEGSVRIWRTELTQTLLSVASEEVMTQGQGRTGTTDTNAVVGSFPGSTKWERRLVLCHELNRGHPTSQRRYKNNPATTALAMSRSHATLLVGDAWGRVFTWTCE